MRIQSRFGLRMLDDPGLFNLSALYVYTVCPKFSVTKVSG